MDISALVEEIKSHRFDGYGPARIADEIDRFRSGPGTGSLTSAVDALSQVATALTETETTLRRELGELGVSWHGRAGDAAGSAVAEQAGFSGEMAVTLDGAARALFAQGDAFNRTRDKLPSSDEVRKAVGGTNLGDEMMSLIGFETDHAEQVVDAREATQHAVQVLNEYAAESGDNLGSADTGTDPRVLGFSVAPPTAPPSAAAAEARGAPPAPGSDPGTVPPQAGTAAASTAAATTAAGAAPSAGAPATLPGAQQSPPRATTFAAGPGAEAPTPPAGIAVPAASDPGQGHGPSTSTAGAVPPATSTTPAAGGAGAATGGSYGSAGTGYGAGGGFPGATSHSGDSRAFAGRGAGAQVGASAPASPHAPAGRPGGRVVGRVTVPAPGAQAPAGGVINKPYTQLSPLSAGGGAQDAPLARGRMSGLVAQPPSGGSAGSFYAARATAGTSAADIGAGAAALGAGGVAGVLSGERGRPSRGGAAERQPFGAGPDEDEAEAAERIETDVVGEPDVED